MDLLKKARKFLDSPLTKTWPLAAQIKFFQFTFHYVQEGISLYDTLTLVEPSFTKEQRADFLSIQKSLKTGDPLISIFTRLGFDRDVLTLFAITNETERMPSLFQKCLTLLKEKQEFIKFTTRLLAYPLFLLALVLVTSILMVEVIFPQYNQFLGQGESPLRSYGGFILFLRWMPRLLVLTAISILFYFLYIKRKHNKDYVITLIHLQLQIPFVGSLMEKLNSFIFCEALMILLRSNLSLLEGVKILSNSTNAYTAYQGICMKEGLKKGENLSITVKGMRIYDEQFQSVLAHGHTHGNLLGELVSYSHIIREEMRMSITKWLRAVQIIMFSVVLIYVISLYSAILLPMYDLYKTF